MKSKWSISFENSARCRDHSANEISNEFFLVQLENIDVLANGNEIPQAKSEASFIKSLRFNYNLLMRIFLYQTSP